MAPTIATTSDQTAIKTLLDTYERSLNAAHALTRSEGHVTLLESGARAPESNRELFVFERLEGDWKIARYMFNKTTPTGA